MIKEFYLLNKKKLKINVIENNTSIHFQCIILHIHGLGSHFQDISNNTINFVNNFENRDSILSKNNIKSYGLEFHGHGKSDGKRCSIQSYNDLVDDIDIVINYITNKYNQPIFLLTESLGCAIGVKYCITQPNKVRGIICLAPMFGIDNSYKPNYILQKLLIGLSYVVPNLQIINSHNNKLSSSNKDFIELRSNNIYTYNKKHRLCTCRELLRISSWIYKNGYKLRIPILIFHGVLDQVILPKIIMRQYKQFIFNDKTIHLVEGYHYLLVNNNENSVPINILNNIIKWCIDRSVVVI